MGPMGEPVASDPLERLLELQDLDTELDRLAHKRATLPERAELSRLREAVGKLDAERKAVDGRRSGPGNRQAELERAIDEATERIKSIEQRLYHGEGYAFRDQQAMADEVKALEKRRSEMEDEELELLEQLEPIDAELATIERRRAELVAEGSVQRVNLEKTEQAIDAELAVVGARRAPMVALVPEPLEAEYERLRKKFGGVGVSRLVRGSCSGCHLVLPATELDAIHHAAPGALFHCDQCGRLLVP
jgi:predicted  nucleic acid-binding Zn-ribbon protein